MHLDPKALEAALNAAFPSGKQTIGQAQCVTDAITAYFSASLPADSAELVERLLSMPTCLCAGDGTEDPNPYKQAASLIQSQAARIAELEAGELDDVENLFLAARAEADKAMRKFPQPNYVISKVAEEAGEVVKAAIHCAEGRELPSAVADEIKQAMAMLIRLYVEGDQVHGLAPIAARALLNRRAEG